MVAVFKMREKKTGGIAEPIDKTLLDLERNNTASHTKSFAIGRTQKYIYSEVDIIPLSLFFFFFIVILLLRNHQISKRPHQ